MAMPTNPFPVQEHKGFQASLESFVESSKLFVGGAVGGVENALGSWFAQTKIKVKWASGSILLISVGWMGLNVAAVLALSQHFKPFVSALMVSIPQIIVGVALLLRDPLKKEMKDEHPGILSTQNPFHEEMILGRDGMVVAAQHAREAAIENFSPSSVISRNPIPFLIGGFFVGVLLGRRRNSI